MPLTVKSIEAAKAKAKLYRLADGRGLYLEIPAKGNKRWRLRYSFQGKEKMLSLGKYPDISLKYARAEMEKKRILIAKGIDPAQERKERHKAKQGKNTFEAIAREWYRKFKPTWTNGHAQTIMVRLEQNAFPWIGSTPIKELGAPDLLQLLRRIESRGALETAHRVRGILGQVFRYAVASGQAERDPAADLKGALPPTKERHHANITDSKGIAALLRAMEGYGGHHVTRCALKLAPLVFVRPGELRHAEWAEVDLEAAEWRIPKEKMKAGRPHNVPLSRQALTILKELHPLTGACKYLFPSVRTSARPMSENTVNAALRRLGYSKDEMTGHGFRSMASTNLNEQGWNKDVIERQLAHVEGNSVRAAYNHADYMNERTKMMQAWADYLDGLKSGCKVVSIKSVG